MTRVTKSFGTIVATTVVAGLLLAACGAPGTSGTPEGTTASGNSNQAPTHLRMSVVWPVKIDPAVGNDYASAMALINLYDSLVYPEADGTVSPDLAESWKTSDDGLTYTFTLVEGATFHSGNPVTAEDVAFSFQRLADIGSGFAYLFKDVVQSVETPNPRTVVFRLVKPFGPFLSILTRLYVVDKETVLAHKASGDFGENGDYGQGWLVDHDAGSGAYEVDTYDPDNRLVMRKFTDYHGKMDRNAPDYVEFLNLREDASNLAQLRQGTVDITHQWMTPQSYATADSIEGVDVAEWGNGGEIYVMLNTKKPPLDDLHVRRALSYAFDYAAEVGQIYAGSKQPRGPVSQILPGADPEVMQYMHDLDKAREELAQSKYAATIGQYTIDAVASAGNQQRVQTNLMLQAEAQKIGIKIEVREVPWTQITQLVGTVETTPQILPLEIDPTYPEAGSILQEKYSFATLGTYYQTEWLQDDEIDALIDQALATSDKDQRFELYRQIQRKIVDLAPTIFAADLVERHAYRSDRIVWPQAAQPIPEFGYNFDARFIQVKGTK